MNNKNYTRVPLNEIALMINAKSGFNIENLIFRARIEYIRDPDKINADNYSIRLYKEGINVNGFLQSSKNIGSILESIFSLKRPSRMPSANVWKNVMH